MLKPIKMAVLAFSILTSQATVSLADDQYIPGTWPQGKSVWEALSQNRRIVAVAISPEFPRDYAPYFTIESLTEGLPRIIPAIIVNNWCDKVPALRGVIVFDNNDVAFWKSCKKDLIIFEGEKYRGNFAIVQKSDIRLLTNNGSGQKTAK